MNMATTKPNQNPEVAEVEATVKNQDLAAEMKALRSEFQMLVEQTAATGQAAKSAVSTTVRAKAAKGLEVGEHYAEDMMDELREIDRKVVQATRESPWRTLGMAAMVGFILGLILRR